MKFGKFEIDVLDTGIFGLDGGAMFGVVPKNIWSKIYNAGDDLNRIPLSASPMLIRYDNKKILVDTGNGTKYNDKLVKIYNFDMEKGNLDYSLSKLGLKRDEITDVILTHLHFDHCGDSTIIENGKIIPAFANAKYYVQKEHYKWALAPTEKDRASFMKDNYEEIISNGMMEFLDGEGELFDGIKVQLTNGHTKALQMVKLESEGKSLLYCADLSPTSAHINYAYGLGYDNFPLTTLAEKKKYFNQAVEENTLLVFEHDAFCQAAYIGLGDKGLYIKEKVVITDNI